MKKLICLVLALVLTCTLATTAFAANTDYTASSDKYESGAIVISNNDKDGTLSSAEDNTWNITIPAALNTDNVNEEEADEVHYVVVKWDTQSTLTWKLNETAYSWTVYSADGDDEDTDLDVATNGQAVAAGYVYDYTDGEWTGEATVHVTIENWSNCAVKYELAWETNSNPNDTKIEEALEIDTTQIGITNGAVELASCTSGTKDPTTGLYTTAATEDATVTINAAAITAGAINASDAVIGTVTVTLYAVENSESTQDPGTT